MKKRKWAKVPRNEEKVNNEFESLVDFWRGMFGGIGLLSFVKLFKVVPIVLESDRLNPLAKYSLAAFLIAIPICCFVLIFFVSDEFISSNELQVKFEKRGCFVATLLFAIALPLFVLRKLVRWRKA